MSSGATGLSAVAEGRDRASVQNQRRPHSCTWFVTAEVLVSRGYGFISFYICTPGSVRGGRSRSTPTEAAAAQALEKKQQIETDAAELAFNARRQIEPQFLVHHSSPIKCAAALLPRETARARRGGGRHGGLGANLTLVSAAAAAAECSEHDAVSLARRVSKAPFSAFWRYRKRNQKIRMGCARPLAMLDRFVAGPQRPLARRHRAT